MKVNSILEVVVNYAHFKYVSILNFPHIVLGILPLPFYL
jgi:hypothetical protein